MSDLGCALMFEVKALSCTLFLDILRFNDTQFRNPCNSIRNTTRGFFNVRCLGTEWGFLENTNCMPSWKSGDVRPPQPRNRRLKYPSVRSCTRCYAHMGPALQLAAR